MKFILLDIEGTVSPISFVKDILFPYSKSRLSEFLSDHKNKHFIKSIEEEIQKSYYPEFESLKNHDNSSVLYLEMLIQKDIKSTLLKEIQGEIWKEGFENGELKSPMFKDVLPFLKREKDKGTLIGIYSSGSVLAQKLFFKYSDLGDLSEYISAYFDTNMGSKRESNSYLKIIQEVGMESSKFYFYTDIVEEGMAARESGIQVGILLREGNSPQDTKDFIILKDFNSLV
jgi:enolase-phosphatase E1